MSQTDRQWVAERALDASTPFRSVLFPDGASPPAGGEPACLGDLNLDQIVASVVGRRDDYQLAEFFHAPLCCADDVAYRQAVFRDLQDDALRASMAEFAERMRKVRAYRGLARKQRYVWEKRRWLLDAAQMYCEAVEQLAGSLGGGELESRGLLGLRDHLQAYRGSTRFSSLMKEADAVLEGLSGVRYSVRIKGGRVTVQRYADEPDYTVEIEQTFARFREGRTEDHLVAVPDSGSMDHVEAKIAELVSQLHPDEFAALEAFCAEHEDFLDPLVTRFDRELQFYLAYLRFIEPLRARGVPFTLPTVTADWSETHVEDGVDLALADKGGVVVPNEVALGGAERILVVTGPNQGGKTTFARMVGQLHYLAALGVPVPARSARLVLPDRVFTVFGRREDVSTLRGRLDDELVQLKGILDEATGRSLILLNEVFASTTLHDAVGLGDNVLRKLTDLGCAAVWVTFVDELADRGPATVSMVASVEPDDPSTRTFKVVRRAADGRAYAWAIAQKYGLSYAQLKRRITP